MHNKYYQNIDVTMPTNAIVTSVNGNTVQTSGDINLNNVKVLSLNGIVTKPDINDEVVLLPLKNGEYIALGNILNDDVNSDCEFVLKSVSGGRLTFFKDGSISMNGFRISKDGDIMV